MNIQSHKGVIICYLLIALGLTARLLPHPANFAPIGALALFGGMYLPKRQALLLPLAALFISDLFIGMYNPKMMIAVYGSFAVMGYIGMQVRKKKNLSTIIGGTVLGSIAFFLITNAAVWLFGTMYPHTLAGLGQSYTMAIPFFRNSLLGDLFYMGIFIGIAEGIPWIQARRMKLAKKRV